MTPTDWIQAISMVVLVIITVVYAWRTHAISKATKKQAEASVKMAEEMREQRYDTVRPVIDIYREQSPEEQISEALSARDGDTSHGLSCVFHNIGPGPAIDAYSFVQNPFSGEGQRLEFGTLAAKERSHKMKLSLNQEGSRTTLVVYYRDVNNRSFESRREVSIENNNWILSPLRITLLKEENKND